MPKTIHDGHRHRMRERFRADGLEGFAPHEVMELLMYYSRPRGDVNPLAHQLLTNFGSLKGILEAGPDQLMSVSGVGEETATLLSMIVPLFRYYETCFRDELTCLNNPLDVQEYCISLLTGWRTERFYMLALNACGQLLGHRLIATGSLSEVPTYPRLIVEAALNYNAHAVILCHNHPGGTLGPSRDDVVATRRLQPTLTHLQIILIDHIIVAGNKAYSMVLHGDLKTGPHDKDTSSAPDETYTSGKEGNP